MAKPGWCGRGLTIYGPIEDELAFHPSEVIEDVHQLAPVALSFTDGCSFAIMWGPAVRGHGKRRSVR